MIYPIRRNGKLVSHGILHCADVPSGWAAARSLPQAVKEITQWHRQKGWAGIGYHYIMHPSGDWIIGRSPERAGAHCAGFNGLTMGILLLESAPVREGGRFSDAFTDRQRAALLGLMRESGLSTLSGHNDHAARICPGFSVQQEFPSLYKKILPN